MNPEAQPFYDITALGTGLRPRKPTVVDAAETALLKRVKQFYCSTKRHQSAHPETCQAAGEWREHGNHRMPHKAALPEDMNLLTIPHMAEAYQIPVGLSDHTLGIAIPVAAVALGACIIEKHLTQSRADGGPEAAFSLEPAKIRAMVDAVRVSEKALGKMSYDMSDKERASSVFRRSLFVAEDIEASEPITKENIRSIRPGYELPVKELPRIVDRKATENIRKGTPLSEKLMG